uniref:Myosin class ii heavy chain n=1 Tax=Nippostrongylus brasiliensis TaxID=27835 RepID=A0A0N4XGY3_NIPBR
LSPVVEHISSESLPEQRVQVVSNRSSRRQRQSARKKTVVVIKPKVRAETKKAEKPAPSPKSVKEVKTRAPPRRRGAAAQAEKPEPAPAPAAPKRLRKGYVYEVVPAAVPPPQSVPSVSAAVVNGYRAPSRSECGTQTMGGSHIFSALIDQFINGQAEKCAGSPSETPSTLPSFVSRRLMVSQQLLMRQNDELNRVQEENRRLLDLIKHMNSIIRKFGDEYAPELRHLRDAIGVLKRELLFYQEEFVAEAKKSINNIQAKIDLHIKEKEAAEERADGYLREISVRDRDVILANKSKERAERKLNDSLYVANNAKCAHCQISDKMRAHLTDVVAEKTVLLDKCRKECADLQRRADHAERISKILSKDSEKLRFELNTWKSDAERNVSEIARLREELKKSTASQQSNGNASPPKAKVKTVERGEYTNTSPVANAKIASNAVQTSQVAPMVSTTPDDPDSPFSSWLPKGRKVDSSPPVSFFNAPQPSARQPSAQIPSRRPFPFNGPVVADGFLGKDVVKTEEKTTERTPILSSEPRTCAISPAATDRSSEPPVPNVERQVPLMPKKKKKKAATKDAHSFDSIGPPRFFGGGKPGREAFISDRVEPFSGKFIIQ